MPCRGKSKDNFLTHALARVYSNLTDFTCKPEAKKGAQGTKLYTKRAPKVATDHSLLCTQKTQLP